MSNPITVELPADLPTNWQQYQVVSPNGTEAGLDEQHGYNYLMEQVNNAQTAAKECGEALGDTVPASREINGHPLTDDVTLTGADINVSGTDSTSISTALSNKVNAGAPQVYDLPLSSGWTNYGTSRSRYWRNQFGEVSVIVDISNDGAVQHSSVVAQLPTGFRPAENFDVPAVLYDGNNQTCLKCFVRAASGEIIVASIAQTTWPEVTYFIAQLTFMASS